MWNLLKRVEIPLKVTAVIALVYLGYVFLSRRSSSQQWAETHKPVVDTAREAKFDAAYGGTQVKITQFFAREGAITEGQETVVCYGVVNAKSVKIEPPIGTVYPALNNCISVSPRHDTKYTLTAEGADGHIATADFNLAVGAAPVDPGSIPKITSFQVVKHTNELGKDYFTIAYQFENARAVSIDPPVFSPLEDSAPFGQFMVAPTASTTYTLTVTNAKGRKATRQLTVTVPQKSN
jgi:hypothetical protein